MRSRQGFMRSGLLVFFTAISIVLAVVGNLLGNVVAEDVPSEWKSWTPTLLVLAVALYLVVNVSLARLQDTLAANWRKVLNRRLRFTNLFLLVLDAMLAATGGLLSNIAASRLLPARFVPYAPLFYVGVILLALAISLLIYWLQSTYVSRDTKRNYLLDQLRDRYETLRNGALQGESSIDVRIAWEVGPLPGGIGPGERRADEVTSAALPFFDASAGHLLLLGQPGAGKSVLLAELGLNLLRRARNNHSAHTAAQPPPIPVIFPLSTWAINRKPLTGWLVESLIGPPNLISKEQAEMWVNADAILPLLDGLDEVGNVASRDACVRAINEFRAAHPRVPVVVTSRIQEYREQTVPLNLIEANVEPLSDAQIIAYLEQAGSGYDALRKAVLQNSSLRDVLRTLLFLRVVMRTYPELDPEQIPPISDQDAWVEQLFREYVAQMLKRPRDNSGSASYSPEKVTAYLSWLATEMRAHKLSDFFLKRVELDWIPGEPRYSNHLGRYRLISISAGLLFAGPTGGLIWTLLSLPSLLPVLLHLGLGLGTATLLLLGAPGWVISVVVFVVFVEKLQDTAADIADNVEDFDFEDFLDGLTYILSGSVSTGFETVATTNLEPTVTAEPEPAEAAREAGLLEDLGLLRFGDKLICWFVILVSGNAVGAGLELGLQAKNPLLGLLAALVVGVVLALLCGSVVIVSWILSESIYVPLGWDDWAPGIVSIVLVTSVTSSLIYRSETQSPILYGIASAILVAVAFLWLVGGVEVYRIAVFRALLRKLRRVRVIPRRYKRFLDYAANQILLQKVGVTYRFIHPLLRDYFANRWEGSPPTK